MYARSCLRQCVCVCERERKQLLRDKKRTIRQRRRVLRRGDDRWAQVRCSIYTILYSYALYLCLYIIIYCVCMCVCTIREPTPIVKESNRKTGNVYFTASCTTVVVVVVKCARMSVYSIGIYNNTIIYYIVLVPKTKPFVSSPSTRGAV